MTPRPFQLMIDSGSREEPPIRYFGSLEKAYEAYLAYPEKWHPFGWITEQLPDGGRRTHLRDGKIVVG